MYYKGFCLFSKLKTGQWPNSKAVSSAIEDVKHGRYKRDISIESLYYSPSFKSLSVIDSYATPFKRGFLDSDSKTPFNLADGEQSLELEETLVTDTKANSTSSEFNIKDFEETKEIRQQLETNHELSDEAKTESENSSDSSDEEPEISKPPCEIAGAYELALVFNKKILKSIPYTNTSDKELSLALSSSDSSIMQVINAKAVIKPHEQGLIKIRFFQALKEPKKAVVYLLVTVNSQAYECFQFKLKYLT